MRFPQDLSRYIALSVVCLFALFNTMVRFSIFVGTNHVKQVRVLCVHAHIHKHGI